MWLPWNLPHHQKVTQRPQSDLIQLYSGNLTGPHPAETCFAKWQRNIYCFKSYLVVFLLTHNTSVSEWGIGRNQRHCNLMEQYLERRMWSTRVIMEWNQHTREKRPWMFWHKWPDSSLIYTGPGPLASRWYICEACKLNSFLIKAFRLNNFSSKPFLSTFHTMLFLFVWVGYYFSLCLLDVDSFQQSTVISCFHWQFEKWEK